MTYQVMRKVNLLKNKKLNSLRKAASESVDEFSGIFQSDQDYPSVDSEFQIKAKLTTSQCIETWKKDWLGHHNYGKHASKDLNLDWEEYWKSADGNKERFLLSLFYNNGAADILAALCLIRVKKHAVTIYVAEGNPDDTHLLKGYVTLILLDIADRFAHYMGKSKIRLEKPANDKLIQYYVQEFGFSYDAQNEYCELER
ncbi:hypothetical protein SAMN04488518_104347 [Pseudovibrio ascidiaceicola]|uniref:N-acetyltransferase domain-containing protein n=1 Tax=Pseudovibrio ascidiaceicola TaxID=285279 RepID=A0A1I3Z1W8_9HYPH|nr:hypothetical protein [Pseudovibrio ascidiaceicola]SFK37629.1 hypothetical protein SAMN04488518_104347 [Pseudovibrio ascidiaceicola]